MEPEAYAVVYFDGVCGLCNTFVDKLMRHDKKKRLRFATLQSEHARHLLDIEKDGMDSVILEWNGKVYHKTAAGIRALALCGRGWVLMKGLLIFPPFLRDFFYDIIARNRYKWWGKKESCRIPTPEERERFLV